MVLQRQKTTRKGEHEMVRGTEMPDPLGVVREWVRGPVRVENVIGAEAAAFFAMSLSSGSVSCWERQL